MRRLRELRAQKQITQAELGKILNVSASTIGMYEQGRREPDNPTLIKIADYFGVSMDYLLERQQTPQHFSSGWLTVPVAGGIAAGPGINSPSSSDDTVDIPPSIAQGHTADDFLVVVAKGCSMEPNIMDGDRLVFLRDTELHGSRRVHAISFDDYDYTAKLVKQDEDGNIIITAYNSTAWEPLILSPAKAQEKNLQIHGHLVYQARFN